MMARSIREHFTVTTNPWTLNGEPMAASTPAEALEEIHASAKRFPVLITIDDDQDPIHLLMDKRGRTKEADPALTDSEEPQDLDPQDAHSLEAQETEESEDNSALQTLGDMMSSEEESDETQEDTNKNRSKRRRMLLGLGVGITALFMVGLSAFAILPSTDKANEAKTKQGWKIDGDPDNTVAIGNYVVTITGNDAEVYAAKDGQHITGPIKVDGARFIDGDSSAGFDTGTGKAVVLHDGTAETYTGTLNARGAEPLVIDGKTFTTANGDKHDVEKGTSVLGASTIATTTQIKAPATVITGDDKADLARPKDGAKLSGLIQATKDQVVLTWKKDNTNWITINDSRTGELMDSRTVKPDQVKFKDQIVWVDDKSYVSQGKFKSVCPSGTQTNGQIVCPSDSHWTIPDLGASVDQKPISVSKHTVVTQDHRVEPIKENQ